MLHGENTNGTAQSILRSDNAVVVVPRDPLAPGTYTSTVNTTGGNVTWSFTDRPDGRAAEPSIDLPDTAPASARSTFEPVEPYPLRRLPGRAGKVVRSGPEFRRRSSSAAADITAVSANFTVDRPSAAGFLTVYNCSAAVPIVSTLNFTGERRSEPGVRPPLAGQAVPVLPRRHRHHHRHQRLLPGRRPAPTRPGSSRSRRTGSTTPGRPTSSPSSPASRARSRVEGVRRRRPNQRQRRRREPHRRRTVRLRLHQGLPVRPEREQRGLERQLRAAREPAELGDRPDLGRAARSASSPTPPTDLLVDIAGYFVAGSGYQFTPLVPVRLLDTRSPYAELNPATPVARRSSPARSCGSPSLVPAGSRPTPRRCR